MKKPMLKLLGMPALATGSDLNLSVTGRRGGTRDVAFKKAK